MQRNNDAEKVSKFYLEFFQAILKVGGVRGAQCDVVPVMAPVKESKFAKVDPLEMEWKECTEFVGSVPMTQEKEIKRTLEIFKLGCDYKKTANNRLGFAVQQSQVEEKFRQGQEECALIYFIIFHLHRIKNNPEKFKINDPGQDDRLLFFFHPCVKALEYYGFKDISTGINGLPAMGYCFIKEGPGDKIRPDTRGEFLECASQKHYPRGGGVLWWRDYHRIPNLYFLAYIMHCQLAPRLRNREDKLTPFQESVTTTLPFFPKGIQNLVLDYLSEVELPVEFIKYVTELPKKDASKVYTVELTCANIRHLMGLLEEKSYDELYRHVDEAYRSYWGNLVNQKKLCGALINCVADEKSFSVDNTFNDARKEWISELENLVNWLPFSDDEVPGKRGVNFCSAQLMRILGVINNFWKTISADRGNLYYYHMSNFFCCEAYEKEHRKPFPTEVTEEILLWVAARHGFELSNTKEQSPDETGRPRQAM